MASLITREQYEKSLRQAHEQNLRISETGANYMQVVNPAHDGCYTVWTEAHVLRCNCPAGERGVYCKHRALVHEALVARAAKPAAPVASPETVGWLSMTRDERFAWLAANR